MNKKTLCLFITLLLLLSVSSAYALGNSADVVKSYKVAAVQFNPVLNERDQNIEALAQVVEEAAKNGAKLIVAPEMSTTGYYYKNRAAIQPFVDTIPGAATQRMTAIAKKYDAYIVFGLAEEDKVTHIYYNAAALVGPNGTIGKYRKTHQWETEEHWAAWGDMGVPVYETPLGKIAINICMDSAYFESARLAAVKGADILAFPTNSSAQAIAALQARAEQNGLYIVSANRSNTENGFHMIGASAVWSPDGAKLAEAAFSPNKDADINEPTILYTSVDPAKYQNAAKKRLSERRPDLYQDLTLYIGPWDYTKNTASHDVNAAALQYEPVLGDKEANLAKISQLLAGSAAAAADQGQTLDLVVLPELSATGPTSDRAKIAQWAEPLSGGLVASFKELAKQYQTHLVFGFAEADKGKYYNTAVLLNPLGEIIGTYRKTHLDAADTHWASQGDQIEVFNTAIGKVGLMIGYDAAFPEVAGVMAVNRADIIAIPSSWNGQFGRAIEINSLISAKTYPQTAMCTWDSVAMSAEAYTLVANYVGSAKNYQGSSSFYTLDPLYGLDQPLALDKAGEGYLLANFATLQSTWWWNQENLILSRQPQFYKRLVY